VKQRHAHLLLQVGAGGADPLYVSLVQDNPGH